MRIYQTPTLVQRLFPDFTWSKKVKNKQLFLTFDDGPIPEVTEFVLSQLERYNAKATFFCVGENILKNPEIARKICEANHRVGNHTFHHLNGWESSLKDYLSDISKCQEALKKTVPQPNSNPKLFRPPYGKITRNQAAGVKSQYEIVMWDVLSYDFDNDLLPEKCLQKTIRHAKPGSVIVFHDSLKARRNLEYSLPRFLDHFCNLDYTFSAL